MSRIEARHGVLALAGALLATISLGSATALAATSMHLKAALTPERLGGPTSIGVGIEFIAADGRTPPPLRRVEVRYPNNLGLALSGLGIEVCTAAALELGGPAACPANSVMGYGSAIGEIPFGPVVVKEPATLTIVRAEDQNGQIAMLFDAQGITPVKANIVLPGVLLPARPPYGGNISIALPLVPSLPEAPDVSVGELQATLGPASGLVYSEERGGQSVPYSPKGILLPNSCPRGGFQFSATASFIDGTSAIAHARVPCARGRRARHAKSGGTRR
jgi:hypothetical protein